MKLLHYLFEIPIILIAIWGIYNAQIADDGLVFSLWPLDTEVHVNTKLLLFCFLFVVFVCGFIISYTGIPVKTLFFFLLFHQFSASIFVYF